MKRVRGLLTHTLILLCIFTLAGAAEVSSRTLFQNLPGARTPDTGGQKAVMRARSIAVDFGAVLGTDRKDGADTIDLNLFADTQVTATRKQFDFVDEKHFSWIGSVPGDPTSAVILVGGDGLMSGSIAFDRRHFAIASKDSGEQTIFEIDQSRLPPEGCDNLPVGSVPPKETSAFDQPLADSASSFEVLVVYTPAAQTAAGGATSIANQIDLAIAQTNLSYANSGLLLRVHLAARALTSYTEAVSGDPLQDWKTDVQRLRTPGDGFMDEVHQLREAYKADVVVLVSNQSGVYCGSAPAGFVADKSTAFCAVRWGDCMTTNYSFGHEIGHLQGAEHDLYIPDDDPDLPFPFNHGHINLTHRQRTMMSYNNLCADTPPGTPCTRVLLWSSDTGSYPPPGTGVIPGSATEDNTLALNVTADIVANFLKFGWRTGEADGGSGWKWLDWFGWYNIQYWPWINHPNHGWLYASDTGANEVFFYDDSMSRWWYTNPSIYPFLYLYGPGETWMYYEVGSSRWFYNYLLGMWQWIP